MTTEQPKDITGADLNALESLVDTYGLAGVVEALGTIAWLKADHVRAVWFHESLARNWSEASRRLRAISKQDVMKKLYLTLPLVRNTSPK